MRDLAGSLEALKDDLASIQHEIVVLEQALREIASVVDRYDGEGADASMRAHLDVIAGRMSAALAEHAAVSWLLEECGHERHRVSFGQRTSLRRGSQPEFA
jgi:hypothetical protein